MRRFLLQQGHFPPPLAAAASSSSIITPHHHNPRSSFYLLPLLRLLTTTSTSSTDYQALAIQTRLQELGVDQRTLRLFAFSSRPTQWDTVQLLLDQGFTAQRIRTMLQKRVFLLPCHKLASFIAFLDTLNVTGQLAGNIISKFPSLLTRRVVSLERKVTLFKSFGLERERMKKLFVFAPRIFCMSDDTFRRRIGWLQDLGIENKGIRFILDRNPNLICCDPVKTIVPKLESLQSLGISKASIVKVIGTRPLMFSGSKASMLGKIDLFRQLGCDKKPHRLLAVISAASSFSKARIVARFNTLIAHGLSSDQVRHILVAYPPALFLSEDHITKKIHYLTKELNRDIEEIARCPCFLNCSLERKIIPRFKLLADAKEKGLMKREFSLNTILTPNDTDFHEWVMRIQKESRNKNSEADSKSCIVAQHGQGVEG